MVHPASDKGQTPLLGTPAGNLVLRVGGDGPDGQTVQIASAKCTVGSGRNCTLRLCGAGVQPLHCLILRGAIGTIVRNWAPSTRLNGAAFADAPLRAGDRLRCGPVELEVLDPQAPPNKAWDDGPPGPTPLHGVCPRGMGSLSVAPAATTTVAPLRAAVGHTRTRARRLVQQLRQARDRIAQLDSLLASEKARGVWAADHLRHREEIHGADREEMAGRIADLEETIHGAESARQKLADELAAEAAKTAAHHQTVVHELKASLRSCEGQLEADRQARDDLRHEIDRLRADHERQEADWNERLEQSARTLDAQAKQIRQQEEEEYFAWLVGRARRQPAHPSGTGTESAIAGRVVSETGTAGQRPSPTPVTTGHDADDPIHKSGFLTGVSKLSVAVAGIIAGAMVLAMVHLQAPRSFGPDVFLGIVALLLAVVWGLQGATILRRVRQAKAVRSIVETSWRTDQGTTGE